MVVGIAQSQYLGTGNNSGQPLYQQKQITSLLKILKSLFSVMLGLSYMLRLPHMVGSVQFEKPAMETFSLI